MRILPVLAALGLAACMAPAPQEGPPPPATTGQALAQAACPHRIAEANAWVNHMPGASRAPRDLNIDVKLMELSDTAVLIRSGASTPEKLVLEIRTSPTAPVTGRLAYRETAPNPMYKAISFFCRGGEIHAITQVEKVY